MKKFTFAQRVALAVVPRVASVAILLLGWTLRFEDTLEPGVTVGEKIPPPSVFVFWHRTLLMAAHRFRGMKIAILISPSFDGELIARTVERLGFTPVRGSSSKGGAAGLLAMETAYRAGFHIAITADGPRGPVYVAKPGAAALAAIVGSDVGAFHAEAERSWELKSWDKFVIPKPFTRVRVGWPAHCAADAAAVQAMLDRAVEMAAWGS